MMHLLYVFRRRDSYSRPIRKQAANKTRIVHWHDIATAITKNQIDNPLKGIGVEPILVPLNQPIDQLFTNLKRQKRHLAIVVDQAGTLRGLVTMEDRP